MSYFKEYVLPDIKNHILSQLTGVTKDIIYCLLSINIRKAAFSYSSCPLSTNSLPLSQHLLNSSVLLLFSVNSHLLFWGLFL